MLAASRNSSRSRDRNWFSVRSGRSSIHSYTWRRISGVYLLRRPRGPEGGLAQLPVR